MDQKTMAFLKHYLQGSKGTMALSVLFSVASVFIGFVPYYAVYKMIALFVDGQACMDGIVSLSLLCVGGYVAKQLLFEISTTVSHHLAYTALENIRTEASEKLMKLPMGYVLDQPVGKLKNVIVDQADMIELPLAHLIPEGTAYILAPLAVFVVLFVVHPLMAVAWILHFVL